MLIRLENYDPDFEDEKNIEDKGEKGEKEEKDKVKEKEFGTIGAAKVAYEVLQRRMLLKERIDTVGEELAHPLTRLKEFAQSIQKEYKELQDEGAQLVQDRWDYFSKQLDGFVTSVDVFFSTPDKPELGARTAALIQQGLDLLDQVRFLNL